MTANYQKLAVARTIAPSASAFFDFNMEDLKYCRLGTEIAYNATAATTGMALYIYSGIGPLAGEGGAIPFTVSTTPASSGVDTFPFWGDNSTNAVSLTTITPSATSAQRRRTSFYLDFPQIRMGSLVRFAFVNQDAANAGTLSFYADIS